AIRPPPAVDLIGNGYSLGDTELRLVNRATHADNPIGVRHAFNDYMALNPKDANLLAVPVMDERAGTQDLALMDLQTAKVTPLTETKGFTANPVWSVDGSQLAYTYQPPNQLDDIYVWDRRTGTRRGVILTPTVLEHVEAWSHDGKFLLIFSYDEKATFLSSWSFESKA